ncbi:MAG: hypothetical protein Q9191_003018 [Dirinaria sp. TL-2023a]
MNGTRPRQASSSSSIDTHYGAGLQSVHIGAKALVDAYSSSGEHPRYDVMSRHRPPPTPQLLNMDDPVAMHLLMETAMGDSQQFHVLSYEEIDAIKKELSILGTRIDGTKRKLVLETKLRDAAQSLNRLQDPTSSEMMEGSPKGGRRHRRSTMGSKGSFSDMLNKTDDELAISTRKCEDLAQELWGLEKRAEILQTKLLEHTAGILQKTHKGFLEKDNSSPRQAEANGHLIGRTPVDLLDLSMGFDDRSFYQTLDILLDTSSTHGNAARGASKEEFAHYDQAILETERKLEDFNRRLRNTISQQDSHNHTEPVPPIQHLDDSRELIGALDGQLSYLERNFSALQRSQDASTQQLKHSVYAIEEHLGVLNTRLRSIITRGFQGQKSEYPLPPEASGTRPDVQVSYLEAGLGAVEQSIHRLSEDNRNMSSKAASIEEAEHYKTVLRGLWEILVGGEEELRRQDPVQREVSGEEFSLQLFSTKVQTLFARATGLQEQKEILSRQVQQQRELNTQSDSAKDTKISEMSLEIEKTKQSLAKKEREVKEAQDSVELMTERVDTIRQEASLLEQQRGLEENEALAAEKEARHETEERLYADLSEKQERLAEIENELAETKDDFGIANAEMLGRLEESEKRMQSLTSDYKTAQADKDKAHNELQEREGQMIMLQTELTVAKAELDAAYGTRAERAAENAAKPAKQQEYEEVSARNKDLTKELENFKAGHNEMSQRVQTLQRELTETIGEYEAMTKSTIEFEREREQLESSLDTLRDRCEALETQLSEEKVRSLGVKSPGSVGARDSMSPGTTSTQVLKNEFKKMMRDTRAENMRALRYEQEERRKLEALVRTLKRDQTPTKSSLNQSMTAQ